MVAPTHSIIYKPAKDLQRSSAEILDKEKLIEDGVSQGRHSSRKLWIIIIIMLLILLVVCLFCSAMFLRQAIIWSSQNKKHEIESDLLRQMSVSKFEKNEHSAIFWNFQSGFQTVRTMARGEPVCYVFKIDNSSYTSFLMQNNGEKKDNKPTKTNLFYVHSDTRSLNEDLIPTLGHEAYEACKNDRVVWLTSYPLDHQDGASTSLPDDEPKRWKRNIRSCRTSCCYRVCCCDVHHFIWEVAEEFNCNHVCNRCSKFYRPVVQRIC